MLQYVELAYLLYDLRVSYAGLLYLFSFWANFASCQWLYRKRMELYTAIRQCHLIPIVQAGRVRYALTSMQLIVMTSNMLFSS